MWTKDLLAELRSVLEKLPEDMMKILERAVLRAEGSGGTPSARRARTGPLGGKLTSPDVPSWQEIGQQFLNASYVGTIGKGHRAQDIAEMVRLRQALERPAIEKLSASGAMTNALKGPFPLAIPSSASSLGPIPGLSLGSRWAGLVRQQQAMSWTHRGLPGGITMGGGMPGSLSSLGPVGPDMARAAQLAAQNNAALAAAAGITMGGGMPLSLSTMPTTAPQDVMGGGMPLSLSTLKAAAANPSIRGRLSGVTAGMASSIMARARASQPVTSNLASLAATAGATASRALGPIGIAAAVGYAGYRAASAVQEFPQKQLESQQKLADFSGRQMAIFANFENARFLQQRQIGDATANSTAALSSAMIRLREVQMDRKVFQADASNYLGSFITGIQTGAEARIKGMLGPIGGLFGGGLMETLGLGTLNEDPGQYFTRLGTALAQLALNNPKGAWAALMAPNEPTPQGLSDYLASFAKRSVTNDLRPERPVKDTWRSWPGPWGIANP